MSKKVNLGTFVLGPSPFKVSVDFSLTGACYTLVFAGSPRGTLVLGADVDSERALMSNCLHESLEAYFHLTQCWLEPLYLADHNCVNRTLIIDHTQFTEGVADVADFVVVVWPKLKKAWLTYNKKLKQLEKTKRKKKKK